MVLHKIVNGKKVDLSAEEEKAILQEWDENKKRRELKLKEMEAKKAEVEKVVEKMLTGLTEEEKRLIKPKLM